jgi:hypothetical protein
MLVLASFIQALFNWALRILIQVDLTFWFRIVYRCCGPLRRYMLLATLDLVYQVD